MRTVIVALVVAGTLGAAQRDASADKTVLLAPMSTLGEEAGSRTIRKIESKIISGIEAISDVSLIPAKTMLARVKSANRNDLRNCDGSASCLAELGALLSANYVVYGEVGGVGEIQIAYLKLIDVAKKREIRTTTLELSKNADDSAARAAAVRLLVPNRYVGKLALNIDVKGASVFVDGRLVTKSPDKPLKLRVGTHAIRVTHPEYRDFVRFVDVAYASDEILEVGLKQYPSVSSEMRRAGGVDMNAGGAATVEPTPWYRRWYTIAGAGAVVFISSAIVFGLATGGIDADASKTVR